MALARSGHTLVGGDGALVRGVLLGFLLTFLVLKFSSLWIDLQRFLILSTGRLFFKVQKEKNAILFVDLRIFQVCCAEEMFYFIEDNDKLVCLSDL